VVTSLPHSAILLGSTRGKCRASNPLFLSGNLCISLPLLSPVCVFLSFPGARASSLISDQNERITSLCLPLSFQFSFVSFHPMNDGTGSRRGSSSRPSGLFEPVLADPFCGKSYCGSLFPLFHSGWAASLRFLDEDIYVLRAFTDPSSLFCLSIRRHPRI